MNVNRMITDENSLGFHLLKKIHSVIQTGLSRSLQVVVVGGGGCRAGN